MRYKKIISLSLVCIMAFAVFPTSVVCASELKPNAATYALDTKTYTEKVILDDGIPIDVEVTEETQTPLQTAIVPFGYSPKVKVGTVKTFKVRISNASLGFPNVIKGGITATQKKKFIKAASKAITKKMGASFLPGINFATWLLAAIGAANALANNRGFEIGCKMKYSKTYLHKEGFYLYGWQPISAYMKGYK